MTRATNRPAISAEGLVKTFGKDVRALDNLSLQVQPGTVLGLLGPNGAGKTTAVNVLTTLLRPDSGRAEVAGIDVVRDPDAVRRSIGLAGQFAAVDDNLTGAENLVLVGHQPSMGAMAAHLLGIQTFPKQVNPGTVIGIERPDGDPSSLAKLLFFAAPQQPIVEAL